MGSPPSPLKRHLLYKTTVKPRDVLAIIRGKPKLAPNLEFIDGKVIRRPDALVEILDKPEFEVIIDARAYLIKLVETAKVRRARDLKYGFRGDL